MGRNRILAAFGLVLGGVIAVAAIRPNLIASNDSSQLISVRGEAKGEFSGPIAASFPPPEGKIYAGVYLDKCVRQGQVWVCRRRPVYMHTQGKSECARWLGIEDKHEFETFMTAGAGSGDERVGVQSMALNFTIMENGLIFERGTETCANTSGCGKTIKHYPSACRRPRCLTATATHNGYSWRSPEVCW